MRVGVVVKKCTESGLLTVRGLRSVMGGDSVLGSMVVKLLCLLAASPLA